MPRYFNVITYCDVTIVSSSINSLSDRYCQVVYIDMGLLQSCFAKNNKVGVMKEEAEVYEKVRRAMVTEDVTEKKGGLAFGLTFVSEEEPKMPPRRLTELKKEDFEKWRG